MSEYEAIHKSNGHYACTTARSPRSWPAGGALTSL